ncbi:KITH protein, partial [Chloropsis hardwickii]|nr:KITH protein [Chloropsis hardwickii]
MNCLTVPGVHPGSPSRPRGQIQVRPRERERALGHRGTGVRAGAGTAAGQIQVRARERAGHRCGSGCRYGHRGRYRYGHRGTGVGAGAGTAFPDIVEFCEAMANAGKTVIVAALDGTFQRKAFGSILNLVPLAESVVKLNAVCMECYREASYTKRLGAEREVEVIGGADKYHSVCRACYFRKRPQQAGPENKENVPLGPRQLETATPRKIFT